MNDVNWAHLFRQGSAWRICAISISMRSEFSYFYAFMVSMLHGKIPIQTTPLNGTFITQHAAQVENTSGYFHTNSNIFTFRIAVFHSSFYAADTKAFLIIEFCTRIDHRNRKFLMVLNKLSQNPLISWNKINFAHMKFIISIWNLIWALRLFPRKRLTFPLKIYRLDGSGWCWFIYHNSIPKIKLNGLS